MRKLKTQTGVSESADFEENTWTFRMPERYEVAAGIFKIVDAIMFEEMISLLTTVSQQNMSDDLLKEVLSHIEKYPNP